ncbi:MAG TPA: methyltransferase domain-containing protein [Acidobacteriota bacterium]|nr:methyltransferase domain-containing protein [Acidobacteriota bacterium]
MRVLIVSAATVLAWASTLAQNRDPLRYIQILESAERVKRLQVDRVIEELQLREGQVVADLGAGSGLFTRPMAERVGAEGVVYAIDIDSDLLAHIEKTAAAKNLPNIRTVLAGEFDPKIPEAVDLIFISDTLHHIRDPAEYLKNLPRYLRRDGEVALIDFKRNWPSGHDSMQYTESELQEWMKAAGFELSTAHTFLEDHFYVIYRRANGSGPS